jgi:hypothetical protein
MSSGGRRRRPAKEAGDRLRDRGWGGSRLTRDASTSIVGSRTVRTIVRVCGASDNRPYMLIRGISPSAARCGFPYFHSIIYGEAEISVGRGDLGSFAGHPPRFADPGCLPSEMKVRSIWGLDSLSTVLCPLANLRLPTVTEYLTDGQYLAAPATPAATAANSRGSRSRVSWLRVGALIVHTCVRPSAGD